jgi:protein ImuB
VFGAIFASEPPPPGVLEAIARDFSPRVEICGAREVVVDLEGLTRLFGSARAIAQEIRREAADRGLFVRVAVAGTRAAARLCVHQRAGLTIVEPGREAATVAPFPSELLTLFATGTDTPHDPADTRALHAVTSVVERLRRWGIRTLGAFAALDGADIAARLGQDGVEWQRFARGEDRRPLLPSVPDERFEQALDLEWPIEGLEPLSFVLGRLMEPLAAHLERRDRGAAVLHVSLQLVTKRDDGTRDVHQRSLELPTPIKDARTLRTLALLDLESHPPAAALDRVVVAVDPTPARVVQYSLLTRPLPSPEQMSTLVARLDALMGQGRSGSPAPVDSWQPGAFAMQPFAPVDHESLTPQSNAAVALCPGSPDVAHPVVALRRFRLPVPARVRVEAGKPVRVMTDRHGLTGGHVTAFAGPWRTSGNWWLEQPDNTREAWDRDEWEVTLSDGATYRVFRERESNGWFVEGVLD